jgi:ribosomal protection tetracycline resistance protein
METVNIGILAHVDAGKTSLSERLLFDAGVIDELGSVDAGTTQTDSGDIERERGITIRSAVAAFRVDDRVVNLIDTPGHSDFVAEAERALGVLDGAVLVVSAVEGVQAHTRVLMKTLRSLRMPTLVFINKIDRRGARHEELVADIARLLTPDVMAMGGVTGIGTAAAQFVPYSAAEALALWAPVLANHDDGLLAALVNGATPGVAELLAKAREQTAAGLLLPIFLGSALTDAGVPELLDAIAGILPPSPPPEPELRARVFAIERRPNGQKAAYVRSYGGQLRSRQRVTVHRRDPEGHTSAYRGQITALRVIAAPSEAVLESGQIGKLEGLPGIRIGDQIGTSAGLDERAYFPKPSLETVVRPRQRSDAAALHAALLNMADEDPLIQTTVNADGETSVLLYGEVQKEVIGATLAAVYGVPATFSPSEVMHLERPLAVGTSVHFLAADFEATVGLRVEPGDGVTYQVEAEYGTLTQAFHTAISETVRRSLDQGVYGWPVIDITVTLTHAGYGPGTVPGDFRGVTPLVLMEALAMAGTRVYEPCHQFELEVPTERYGVITAHLTRAGARIHTVEEVSVGWRITGEIPARLVYETQKQIPAMTNGEGVWSSVPGGDRAVHGTPPRRPRTDGNPFDRSEYLRFLAQRNLVTGGSTR